jgi:hypothetical protein
MLLLHVCGEQHAVQLHGELRGCSIVELSFAEFCYSMLLLHVCGEQPHGMLRSFIVGCAVAAAV